MTRYFAPASPVAPARMPQACASCLLTRMLLAAMLFPAPAVGLAASVGEARTLSHLGEPLRVEISVRSEGRLAADCVRVAPPDNAQDDIPWVRGARVSLIDDGGELKRIVVVTTRPVDTPVLMLGIHVACGVQLRREYALLLDPPGLQELASPAQTVATEAAPQALAAAPDKGLRRTQAGETPASIASSILPKRPSAQARLARSLVASNAAALGPGATINTPFPEGSVIAIPDAPPPAAPTAAPARPTAERSAPPAAEAPTLRPARNARPHLSIGDGTEGGLQLSLNLGQYKELRETERERLRTEMQLLAALDDKIATQIELTDKLRRLEALQEQLRNDAARLEAELQRQSAPPAQAASGTLAIPAAAPAASSAPAARPAPVAAPEARLPATDWSLLWQGVAVLLLGLTLAGWLWQRRRMPEALPETPAAPEPTVAAPRSQDGMEELFEPLSEADIWPELSDAPASSAPTTSLRSAAAMEGALGPMSVASVGPASILQIEDDVEEHDSAVELAEIMMSFGRVHGAAQTLADFIRSNPKQAVKPWIKLLEVYRAANMRTEFDALCAQLNKTFNVKPVGWEDFEGALRAPESLENMPHIAQKLCDTWGKRECQAYLHELLRDNRQGTRQGFPLAIIDEILLLLAILESHLGAWRPDDPQPQAAAPTTVAPDTMQLTGTEPLIAPLDLAIEDTSDAPQASTAVDFDIDSMDFSKTLHINLDELEPTDTRRLPGDLGRDPNDKSA